jgi:transposase
LETIPGIGVITASALAATITDPSSFHSGRHLAAWIGLVPRQSGTGGKARLGHISKQGDRYLRRDDEPVEPEIRTTRDKR